ncbi:MAG TPA: proton-conducting transporter membrane subunit [Pirellulales bacterium]|nr:proton-conducting transporter membrane subunit [Pirellulales bacterium]
MNPLHLPWVELAIGATIVGSASVTRIREANFAHRCALGFTSLSLLCTLLAWLAFYLDTPPDLLARHSLQARLFGSQPLRLDALNAPLLPSVALLHFLTALATPRTHMRRYSFSWSLAAEAVRLAAFSCQQPWGLVCLLTVATAPPYVELLHGRRPIGVYVLHMSIFAALLILGWGAIDSAENTASVRAQCGSVLLMAAILVRCGAIPFHCWVTDWFEHASLGIAILQLVPLSGVYAAVRLALPVAPDWILRGIGLVSLATAVYAAGMACVQRDSRRFYAFLFLSHASLVLVGLELQTLLSMTASLCLWLSVILSLGGFGLALRAIEARFGRLTLVNYHGLYGHSPTLAVCFLLTGLGCVGFPFTIGFISTELLVDSAVVASPMIGCAVLIATALNGIAVVRAYLLLFTGARHISTVSLEISPRERISVLALAALVLAGGLFPQPGVSSRTLAAEQILATRQK